MSTEKRYTERELVLAQREAFVRGWNAREAVHDFLTQCPLSAEKAAQNNYVLPKITRPRVVRFNDTLFRIVDAKLECRPRTGPAWTLFGASTSAPGRLVDVMSFEADGLRLLADLLANPTETVDDDA